MRLLRMAQLPLTARPGGFSPPMPCGTVFILDPDLGAHGQGLPERKLGPSPRDGPASAALTLLASLGIW